MITFWVLGNRFADDHDRAIRFSDPPSKKRKKELHIPVDSKIKDTYCDKCHVYHLTLEASAKVINSGVAKKESEDEKAI